MTDTPRGQIETVTRQPDGSVVYTHGHRFPDNVQVVEQRHDAAGTLQSARVTWSGFAGPVLDVTATFDAAGKLAKEEGYRAPDMTTPVTELLRPLPANATVPAQAPPPSVSLADGLHRIYPDEPDGSDT